MSPILPDKLIQYEPLDEWNAKRAKEKLSELYTNVLSLTDHTIQWYHNYRSDKGRQAKIIRITAIVLFIISTIIPYFSAISDNNIRILYIGYILAGLGGGLLLFDRYYGLSNSWIRFVLTGMELENLRNNFVENWQVLYFNNVPLTKERFTVMINALLKFQEVFNGTVKAETEQWAKEFQQNLKELAADIQAQSDRYRSGIDTQKAAKSGNLAEGDENVPMEVIREAIARNYEEWKRVFDIVAVGGGKKVKEREVTDINCLVFSPVEKISEGDQHFIPVPPFITFSSVNGRTYDIPTDVRPDGSRIYASSSPELLCDRTVPKRPGCSISRELVDKSSGTLGLKVFKENKAYILGCYHVLCAPELNGGLVRFAPETAMGSTLIVSPSIEDRQTLQSRLVEIGRVTEGYFNDQLDCAIALVNDADDVTARICQVDKPPKAPLTVTDDHAAARYPVSSVGRTTGQVNGTIQEASTSCSIYYRIRGEWEAVTFNGVIRTDQLTQGGDSGAPVFDAENNIIGMIIANSSTFTYIIPIQRILSKFTISLNENI